MRPFVVLILTVAVTVHANMGYSNPSPAAHPAAYEMLPERSASTYGGGSSDSGAYGGGQVRTAPLETVRISYGSGDASGYSASAQDSSASYGGSQNTQSSASSYGGSQSDSSSYGGSQRAAQNVETVRVSYNSNSADSGYAAPSNAGGYGGQTQSTQATSTYGGSQSDSSSYGGSQRTPVDTVRVSYNSNSEDSGYAVPSNAGGYGQSTPAASTYGGSQSDSSSYGGSQRAAQNVETVRVSYNSNSADSGYAVPSNAGGYGGQTQSTPAASSYGTQSDSSSYGGGQRAAHNIETVRVSYGSGDSGSGYSAQNTETSGYGSSQNTPSYGGAQQTESYGGNQQRAQNVETVRVSYNSNSADSGYATPNAAPAYGASQSTASSYGSSQQNDMSSYGGSQRSAPQNVETVRVAYNSGSSDSGTPYAATPMVYNSHAAPSYGSSNNDASSSYGSSSYGATSSTRNTVPVLRHNQVITPGSSHQYDFATGDGITHSETTSVRGSSGGAYGGSSSSEIVKEGQFSYTSPEGRAISLTYQADGRGFRAQGDHLPTPPPIPAEIAKSLRTNAYGSSSQSSAY